MSSASVRHLLEARSVAIVGASERPDASSGFVTRNLLAAGFAGSVWPVHPKARTVYGLSAVPRLDDLPGRPDVVVVAVPATSAVEVVRQAASLGVPAAVVLASGFAETGPAGVLLQSELAEHARAAQMALCGPNCLGIHVPDTGLALFSSRLNPQMRRGSVAIVSHSGATAIALANSGRVGVSHLVSAGNAAVTDIADYLAYFATSGTVRVAALLLEKIADPLTFASAMDQAHAAGVQVVALRTGRSERGARSTAAHTGALAGSNEVACAFLRRHGVIEAEDHDELLETAALLSARGPRFQPGRVAAIGVSGGGLAHFADLAAGAGVELADLSADTQAAITPLLPPFALAQNPLDMTGIVFAEPHRYGKALEFLADDPSVAALVAVQDVPLDLDLDGAAEYAGIAQAVVAHHAAGRKPVVFMSLLSGGPHPAVRDVLRAADTPLLQGGRAGLRALSHAMADRRPRATSPAERLVPEAAWIRRLSEGPPLTERQAKEFLAAHGIPTTRETLARDASSAVEAANAIGWPVAMKIESADIAHKTEVGGVALAIGNEASARAAFDRLIDNARRRAPLARISGVLVQEMVAGGVEVLAGVTRHPPWGLAMTVGPGGIFVELTQGHALDLLPLDHRAAAELIAKTPLSRLLQGFRGAGRRDAGALMDLMARLSQVAEAYEAWIEAIDLNPVAVLSEGQGVRVLDALILRRVDAAHPTGSAPSGVAL